MPTFRLVQHGTAIDVGALALRKFLSEIRTEGIPREQKDESLAYAQEIARQIGGLTLARVAGRQGYAQGEGENHRAGLAFKVSGCPKVASGVIQVWLTRADDYRVVLIVSANGERQEREGSTATTSPP